MRIFLRGKTKDEAAHVVDRTSDLIVAVVIGVAAVASERQRQGGGGGVSMRYPGCCHNWSWGAERDVGLR